MITLLQKFIHPEDITSNPTTLYIFGDNLARRGTGGQAKVMRGYRNSFGIATKRGPGYEFPKDYFLDTDPDVFGIIDEEFERLHQTIKDELYDTVVIPYDGIGTGLAKLPEYAPKLLAYINTKLELLEEFNAY